MVATLTAHWSIAAGLCLLASSITCGADQPGSVADDKRALAGMQAYVGQWRGVGQPKRGSNHGAWTEESEWAWRFDAGRAELVADLTRDPYYSKWQLQAGDKAGHIVLVATPAESGDATAKRRPQRFTGAISNEALVLTADEARDDLPARISLRLAAGGDRLIALYEKQVAADTYSRLAEVGSTRKGSSFAKAVASGPECVVTGGLGKIAVEYKGKTYYVCCTGCRDLFRDDPEGVLAEYRERKATEAAERERDKK
jgi:hypothetical protein